MSASRQYTMPSGRRISKRKATAAGIDFEEVVAKTQKADYNAKRMEKVNKNKVEVAEWNPFTVKPCEDEDREELLFDPEQFLHIDEVELQKFRAAAHDKLGADTHDSMVHLQRHRYNFKEALETIDAVDSVPNAGICGTNGTGYWSPEELEKFLTLWNQMRKYKWDTKNIKLLEIKQMFPQKTDAKFYINRLQMFFCEKLNEKKRVPDQFCEKKVQLAQMERGIRSANCTNCVDKLWMKPVEEYPEVLNLCELCKLYDNTFDRMRPNAAVTPEVFQFGQLNPCKCESLEKKTPKKAPLKKAIVMPEIFNIKPLSPSVFDFALKDHNKECVKALRKCLNKDILAIKGANVSALFEGLVGSSMSSTVMNLAASVNADDTYVFVCRKDIKPLSAFPRFDFGVSSAVGSNENADPIETKKLESLQLCWNLHAHSKKMLSFASIQKTFRLEKHEVKDEWRKEFEAGKAGGPEPDCMLYGNIGANGRITPGTDDTFAEYFNRAKPIITVKASASFTLNEADLTGKNVGECILTPKLTIPCSDGLQYWLDYSPAGWTEAATGFVSVYLFISKPLKTATFTFAVDGSSIEKTVTRDFSERPCNWGFANFASHDQLRPLFRDGKLTITCDVKFEVPTLSFSNPRVFQLFEHIPTDVEFAIGAERVPAHKNFLFMISPVLQAMFTHDTVESSSGIIDITEFDFDIVKTAIDICYGREYEKLLADTAVGVLRFCDKYFITPVIKELEKLPLLHPSVETFCAIVQYAYDCNKDSLLTTCYDFFKEHQKEIKVMEKFAKLPFTLVITIIKFAFDLKTDLEVLCHTKNNGIDFVADHFEKSLIGPITLDNFCVIVTYAWNCSREDLQHECAKFLNENQIEVLKLPGFYELSKTVIRDVLKANHALSCGDK